MNMMNTTMMLAAETPAVAGGGALQLLDLVQYGTIGIALAGLIMSFWLVTQANKETQVNLLEIKSNNATKFRMTCIMALGFSLAIEVAKILVPKGATEMKARVSVAPLEDPLAYGKPEIKHKRGNTPTDIPLDPSGFQLVLQPDDIIAVNLEELKKKTDSIITERDVLKKMYVAPPVKDEKPFEK
jgi:hypothetical protein